MAYLPWFRHSKTAENDHAAFAALPPTARQTPAAVRASSWPAEPADRLIQGDGTPENIWLADPAVAGAAPVSLDQLITADARLVVISPHPDDEVLSCGGLMAMHARRGGKVLVLAVTDGEASHPGSDHWTPATLAAARQLESASGLLLLAGQACAVLRLGLPDGQVASLQAELATRLQSLLLADDVVIVTWRLDGHPDHDAAGEAAHIACASVGCKLIEAPVWMWHWSQPGDKRVPWQCMRALRLPPEVVQVKCAALDAHQSQLAPRSGGDYINDLDSSEGPVLGRHIVERAGRHAEYFFV